MLKIRTIIIYIIFKILKYQILILRNSKLKVNKDLNKIEKNLKTKKHKIILMDNKKGQII
jgi:hypothetical protein